MKNYMLLAAVLGEDDLIVIDYGPAESPIIMLQEGLRDNIYSDFKEGLEAGNIEGVFWTEISSANVHKLSLPK